MTIEQRIEVLEMDLNRVRTRNRWLVAALMLVGTAAFAGIARPFFVHEEVRAKKFIVEDENGAVRAVLGKHDDNPSLILFDEAEQIRAALSTTNEGATLGFPNEAGKLRVLLATRNEGAILVLSDDAGRVRAGLRAHSVGPSLDFFDDAGKWLWGWPGYGDGRKP